MNEYSERFFVENPTIPVPACNRCRHFHRTTSVATLTCDAFPDGIPNPIALGDNDHSGPFPGDHGICFEPIGA